MAAVAPPAALLTSSWRPVIEVFVRKVVTTLVPGQRVTSWYRNAQRNLDEGGSPESQHLFGLAIDVTGPQLDFTRFLAMRERLTTESERDHLHIQLFPPGALRRAGIRFPRAPAPGVAPVLTTAQVE